MDISILKELSTIPNPSNNEYQIVNYIETFSSGLNNFKFYKTKKQSCIFTSNTSYTKNILIDAHIDSVHLRVRRVRSDNYVVATPVGFDAGLLDGNTVIHLETGSVGTIVTMPPHLKLAKKESKKELYIDFAMSNNELGILPGDILIFNPDFKIMNKKSILSNGLDNKASVFILLNLLEFYNKHIDKLKYNLTINFSSREEIGYGSFASVIRNDIDEIVVLDTEVATDNSLISKDIIGNITLGKGPVVTRNHDDDPELSKKFINMAKKYKIPYQVAYSSGFGDSNNSFYTQFFDSYAQFIGVPLRNMHSPTEVVSIDDLKYTLELLVAYLST